ncbi:MAG: vWA domain-containing protein [Flavobacteriales bacterium]
MTWEFWKYEYTEKWVLIFLLLPLLYLVWYFWVGKSKNNTILLSSTRYITKYRSGWEYVNHSLPVFKAIGFVFLILALASPQVSKESSLYTEKFTEGIDIIISLDISGSMLAKDFKPNRLEASKKVAKDFVKMRPNDRIGLVVYEGESFTKCPLTTDHNLLLKSIDEVQTGLIEGGTAIGMGLATAVNRLKDSQAKSKVIILLSDGVSEQGKIHPLTAAEIANEFGIRVYSIGVGSQGKALTPVARSPITGEYQYQYMPVEIDEKTLSEIANITGGKYYRAKNEQELLMVYDEIDQLEKEKIKTILIQPQAPQLYYVLLTIGGIILILERLTKKIILNGIV